MSVTTYVDAGYIVARVLMWTCFVLAVAAPLLYHQKSRGTWSFTPIGKHIMQWNVLFALLLFFSLISVFVPPWVTITASIVLFALAIAIVANQIRFLMTPNSMDPDDFLDDPEFASEASRVILRKDPPMKSRPVLIAMSILGALQFLFGGLVTLNLPGHGFNETALTVGAVGTLVVAASQFGIQFYVQNLVTPHEDVAAFRDKYGQIVAGPAAPPEGDHVDVVDEDGGALR